MKTKPSYLKSISAVLVSDIAATFMAIYVKFGTQAGISPEMLIFGRNLVALIIIFLWVVFVSRDLKETAYTKAHKLQAVRGIATTLSLYFYYYSLGHISLSLATVLYFTIPIFMPFVAYVWKQEKIRGGTWLGIGLGFLGILFVIKPGHQFFHISSIVALLSGLFGAIGQYAISVMHATDSTKKIIFYYFLYGCIVALILTLIFPIKNYIEYRLDHTWYFFVLGIFGLIYVLYLATAIKFSHPTLVATFLYITVIFTMIFDWLIWKVVPNWLSYVGFVCIIGGVFLMFVFQPSNKTEVR